MVYEGLIFLWQALRVLSTIVGQENITRCFDEEVCKWLNGFVVSETRFVGIVQWEDFTVAESFSDCTTCVVEVSEGIILTSLLPNSF